MTAGRTNFDRLIQVLLAVALGVASWSLLKTVDLDKRLYAIENNRFTPQDASDMQEQIRIEMLSGVTDIKRCLNKIQRGEVCDL